MGGNEAKFPSKMATPSRIKIWGKGIQNCNVQTLRIMADQLSKLQVAGRLPPMAGRPRVKKVNLD